jgi:methyl-accepting chemotaxis protein
LQERIVGAKLAFVFRRIAKLGERSSQVGHIIDVIDEIAGRTNLVALNAAIEALSEYGFARMMSFR